MNRLWWLGLVVFLVGCGASALPARPAIVAGTLTPSIGVAPAVTATIPTGVIVHPAQPGAFGHDPSGFCRMMVPGEFREDSPGSGYFPAIGNAGFAGLDAVDSHAGAVSFDDATQSFINAFKPQVVGYDETSARSTANTRRVDFTGSIQRYSGRGTFYFANFGTRICAITFFLVRDVPLSYASNLDAMTSTLQRDSAAPQPTAVPTPNPPAPNIGAPAPQPGTAPTREPVYNPPAPSRGGGRGGCGTRGGPGGPRTSSGKCPAWPK